MTLVILLAFAALALVPLAFSLRRRRAPKGRRDSALALHRAQLVELDRDLAEGRIGPAEHATAKLEVQRRLLAAADAVDPEATRASVGPIAFTLLLVPLAAGFLYLINGRPELRGAPRAEMMEERAKETADVGGMVDLLRSRLGQMDPHSPQAREGYILLGNVEDSRGNLPAAAKAWRTAVDIQFDPTLAAQAAEAETVVEGKVTPDSLALFKRALAAAPDDAPWRKLVESRLAEASTP